MNRNAESVELAMLLGELLAYLRRLIDTPPLAWRPVQLQEEARRLLAKLEDKS